ncbi:MAG: ankyrin repeat domain-containing protein [Rickettsiales bacterium]|nr:ankyrin repeat domain-containing protein [Rickettsiales bacterium]
MRWVAHIQKWWEEIFSAIDAEGDVIKKIKEKLKEKDQEIYKCWERGQFSIHYKGFFLPSKSRLGEIRSGTLLHVAAYSKHLGMVKYLVDKKKLDVNTGDGWGGTPLHWTAREGNLDTVKYLINEKGADPLLKGECNNIPRDTARGESTIQFLKEAEDKQSINKAIKIGVVCGVIAALTVGIGCFVVGAQLSILAIVGVAVAAALIVGGIAGIRYAAPPISQLSALLCCRVTNEFKLVNLY